MKAVRTFFFLLLILAAVPSFCQATNGYIQHGVGVKEQSIGGATSALPLSSMSVANNPATLVQLDNRLDLGLDWFSPSRSADSADGTGYHSSDSTEFLIPELGISYQLSDSLSVALIGYANGGMQTDWPKNFFGNTDTYSSLEQLVIAPTLAYRVTPNHSIGLSLNYIQQAFEARGLQNLASSTPSGTSNYLTDQGEQTSSGWGVRIGYFGKINERLSVGAFWQPETEMDKFSRYRELLPEQGAMNIPESYGAGLAIKLRKELQLAIDLMTIKYSDIATLGNRNNIGAAQLGDGNGPGFGWRDVNVIKLGLAYDYSPVLSLRTGWSHSNNPIRSSETTFNVISPATITDHFTCGMTWKPKTWMEISLTYWHGFENEVSGQSSAANGADSARIKMAQNNIGVAYSWLF